MKTVLELTRLNGINHNTWNATFNIDHCDNPSIVRHNREMMIYYRHGFWHVRSGNRFCGDLLATKARTLKKAIAQQGIRS